MDLSTTTKIKRRVISITPNKNLDLTECSITMSNWLQSVDVTNTKMRISSFYFNNSTIPCFIPKYIDKLLQSDFPKNITTGDTAIYMAGSTSLTADTLDYFVTVRQTSTTTSRTAYISMIDTLSEYPNQKPTRHPSSTFEQYKNSYYWFYNTSKFCDIISDAVNEIIGATGFNLASTEKCFITRTSQGYGLYIGSTSFGIGGDFELQFSQTLIDLFQFKNIQSINSTNLRTLIFNDQTRSYGTPVLQKSYVASNYIPDIWFPFSQLLIKSTFPVEPVTFFDNLNYVSQNFQNILLTFGLNNSNPDGIYNYYKMVAEDGENWCSIIDTNSGENATISVLLELRETGETIPYTIGKNEKFRFIIETIETEL